MINREQAEQLVARLQDAWNDGDAARFAAPFASDADFVTVLGMHVQGPSAIAENHEEIFRTIYNGSRSAFRVEQLRAASADLAILHIGVTVDVPQGPLAGRIEARMTTLVDDTSGGPEIVALQNTIVRDLNPQVTHHRSHQKVGGAGESEREGVQ